MRRYTRGHILYGVGVSFSPTFVHCGDENLVDVVIKEVDGSFFIFNCLGWLCFNPCFVVVALIFLFLMSTTRRGAAYTDPQVHKD